MDNIITKIYLVENCYGDPNKVYVGKTSLKYGRKSQHVKTFGNQIIYTYIDNIFSSNKKLWKPIESYWIEQFKQWGFEVLNKNTGGGGLQFITKESRKKMSKPRSSFPTGNKHGNYNKKRLQFPKGIRHNNFNKPKPLRTLEHRKNISKAKKGKSLTHDKTWGENISKGKTGTFSSKSKPVKIINVINNEIIIVRNAKEASKITGISASKIRNLINNNSSNVYKDFIFQLNSHIYNKKYNLDVN